MRKELPLPKIIALWAVPRSVSTAFGRTFSQRDDTTIFNEPFVPVYYFSRWRKSQAYGEHAGSLDLSAADVQARIQAAERPVAFFKDMAYTYLPYADPRFLGEITNTFLIRDPADCLRGWLRNGEQPDEESFGFSRIWTLFQEVTERLGHPPIVVDGGRFRRAPEAVLRVYCKRIGIPFDPEMLDWKQGRYDTRAGDESLMKLFDQDTWHRVLDKSTGILPPERSSIEIPTAFDALLESSYSIYKALDVHAVDRQGVGGGRDA